MTKRVCDMLTFEEWVNQRLQAPDGYDFSFENGEIKLNALNTEEERKLEKFLSELLRKEYNHYVDSFKEL